MELVAWNQSHGMRLREADAGDEALLAEFMLATPIESETAFVMDRTPRFSALPELRGRFRTFIVEEAGRVNGIATALWRPAFDRGEQLLVGELLDVRIAERARGGRTAFLLFGAVREALVAEGVRQLFCLIGRHNQVARVLTGGRAGLPKLNPLASLASANLIALALPRIGLIGRVEVRAADAADRDLIEEFLTRQRMMERFAPADLMAWPDLSGRSKAWIALAADGLPAGALIAWDGEDVRRVRVTRYRPQDTGLRIAVELTSRLRLSAPLPRAGDVLKISATRLVAVRQGGTQTFHALVKTALRDCALHRRNILQVNLHSGDPVLGQLARYPRSTFSTILYGGALVPGGEIAARPADRFYSDVARA